MNHREPPHPSAAVRKAFLCLAGFALLGSAANVGYALPNLRMMVKPSLSVETSGYLRVAGAPPLRFKAVIGPAYSNTAATTAAVEARSTTIEATPAIDVVLPAPAPSQIRASGIEEARVSEKPAQAEPSGAGKHPDAILTDDIRPAVRAEDFLPYFQIPGTARNPGDVTLLVPGAKTPPAPATLPASSATYTQSPK